MKRPAPAPCVSCPYRRDVASGIWSEEEYAKLPIYDGEIAEQAVAGATGVFHCHQQDGRICAGWAGCHDLDESLAMRLAASLGAIDEVEYLATLDYESPVPLFSSGAEAAAHGLAELDLPGPKAVRTIRRLERRLTSRTDSGTVSEQVNRDEGESE